jgi:FAD/FMN-containing dehydrogenase
MAAPLHQEVNFGGNLRWRAQRYQPAREAEVLDVLARHAMERIRAVGSRHSWSDIAAHADVCVDLNRMNGVEPFAKDGGNFVRAGAGCTIQHLLDTLHATTDQTLPTLGAVTTQTIAGAISTGTHGSGRQSLSHFVTSVRMAAYDPGGRATICEYQSGNELKAARCGLGSLGIVLSVDLPTVPKYKVAETIRRHHSLTDVLRVYAENPLTQFIWTPYSWRWVAFERKAVGWPASTFAALVRSRGSRAFNLIGVDLIFHLGILASRPAGLPAIKSVHTLAYHSLVKNVERVDAAERVLTMRHDYFRHEEMELFVRESKLAGAVEVLRSVTEVFAGADPGVPADVEQRLREVGAYDELLAHRGRYALHYPLFFRRVLPDDTLVSMAASMTEPSYSISIFTYDPPGQRGRYYEFCSFVARTLNRLVAARLHWGKHFPLQHADIAPLYPGLDTFRALCRHNDPAGVFRNDYTKRVLQL